ncbi:MAG TPA: FAD-binding oxidoreductase, partial [Desulfobacteria bacterium]|nr:FAD-binding oxidoreductase [Desulfobacteria bacterium]
MKNFEEIINELKELLGDASVETEQDRLFQYRVDHLTPQAVVFPKNTHQVSDVVKLAHTHNLAIIPWGNGTQMVMGNPPKRLDLVLCTSRMNHIIDVDTANLTITVEAGVKFRDIQARLATQEDRCYLPLEDLATEADEVICSDRSHSGSFLPMDPPQADKATIGGIIATNAGGPRRLLYRLPRDLILGVRMVSPTGDILGSGGKTVKNVSGYDVSKLAVGSMGTLGVICEMTFKLLPLPETMKTLLFSFQSFDEASAFANRILDTTLLPAAVEVLTHDAGKALPMLLIQDFLAAPYGVAVALEEFAPAVARMADEMTTMADSLEAANGGTLDDHAHQTFWLAMSQLGRTLRNSYSGLITLKVTCPISEWVNTFNTLEDTFSAADIPYALQAHAGNGVILANLLMDLEDDEA